MKYLPAITLTGSNRKGYIFSRILIISFILLIFFVIFAPWRQFISGSGRVIAFDALDRHVRIEALVSGRILELNIQEGETIKKGQVVARIQDNDPNLLKNLTLQKSQINARISAESSSLDALSARVAQQNLAKQYAIIASREKIAASQIELDTAGLNLKRTKKLYDQGLQSEQEHEAANLREKAAAAALRSAQANLVEKESTFDSNIATTQSSIESAKGKLTDAKRELNKLVVTLSQNSNQVIRAPRDGIVHAVAVTDGSYLKPGSLICEVVPETDSRFVEIWIDGNDISLIKARNKKTGIPGSPVRLAFEGWPAIQTIGWPQLAVGTFGGEVIFIDATDDGAGRFRIVVGPAVDIVDRGYGDMEVEWPDHKVWLRQGTRARAWLMLDEVPMWKEIWRQMNGFPPIGNGIQTAEEKK